MVEPVRIASVDQLIEQYDLFLFDQFGVLHNGDNTYPGMVECVTRIKAAGRSVAVISNSGKRANYNVERLQCFGFDAALIDRVISSGEVAWNLLHSQYRSVSGSQAKVFFLGRGSDRSAIDGLPLVEVARSDESDLILIAGCMPETLSLDAYAQLLSAAAERGIPAYCTNPDRWSLVRGQTVFGPGQVAERYRQMGGSVTWIGKPHAQIYQFARSQFAVAADRVLCIGDSVEHDIAGAQAAGCDSVLTSTGILHGISDVDLRAEFARYRATPHYLIERHPQ